ncbi:MAG: hypothetical protein IPN49_15750 [Saprospiraceae bacterium]|nr:hypothetical protein [Saprospiraceae bacterium]
MLLRFFNLTFYKSCWATIYGLRSSISELVDGGHLEVPNCRQAQKVDRTKTTIAIGVN